nr:MAG TPA: hypothetical protein [Caudoviricetes sp.]
MLCSLTCKENLGFFCGSKEKRPPSSGILSGTWDNSKIPVFK